MLNNRLVTIDASHVIESNERQITWEGLTVLSLWQTPMLQATCSTSLHSFSLRSLNENLASGGTTCGDFTSALGVLYDAPLVPCVYEEIGRDGYVSSEVKSSCVHKSDQKCSVSLRPPLNKFQKQTSVHCRYSIMGPEVPLKDLGAEVTLPQWS